jgi:hypothetical protein
MCSRRPCSVCAGRASPSPNGSGIDSKIHRDLATLILAELLQRGLIRSDGLPSQAGEEMFQAETLDMRLPVTGHVFQDPWSGDLWPRFVKRLDFAELERGDSGFPDLMLGTRGKPRRERAFMCRPRDERISARTRRQADPACDKAVQGGSAELRIGRDRRR